MRNCETEHGGNHDPEAQPQLYRVRRNPIPQPGPGSSHVSHSGSSGRKREWRHACPPLLRFTSEARMSAGSMWTSRAQRALRRRAAHATGEKKVAAVAQKTSFAAYQPSCHRCEILHLHFQRGPCAQYVVQQVAHGNIHGSRKDAPMQRALRVEHGFHGFERDYTRVIGITHVHAEQARQKKGAEFLLFLAQGTGEHLFALLGKAVFASHRIVSMPAAQCRPDTRADPLPGLAWMTTSFAYTSSGESCRCCNDSHLVTIQGKRRSWPSRSPRSRL